MLFIRNWWILVLRGISSVIFGFYFFFYPELTLFLLGWGFLFFSAIDGILCLLVAFLTHKGSVWRRVFLSVGLLGVAAALFTLYQPLVASALLFITIALWAVFTGVLEIVGGQIFKKELKGTGWLTAVGVISLLFGGLILTQPLVGFSSVENLIGGFQVVIGAVNVILAFMLKLNREKLETMIDSET